MNTIDEILVSRYDGIANSRQEAESILLCRQFKKGEPAIINYRDGEEIRTICAIGKSDNDTGNDAFSIVSSDAILYVRVVESGEIDVSITVHGEVYLWKDNNIWYLVTITEDNQKIVKPITETPRTYIDLISGNIYFSTSDRQVYCLNDLNFPTGGEGGGSGSGGGDIDLSQYATKTWVATRGYLIEETQFLNSPASGITANDISRWNSFQSGETNKIEKIKVNGSEVPIVDKTVNITVPEINDSEVSFLRDLVAYSHTYTGTITASTEKVYATQSIIKNNRTYWTDSTGPLSVTFIATFSGDSGADDIASVSTNSQGWTTVGKTLQKTVRVDFTQDVVSSGSLIATIQTVNGLTRNITLSKDVEIVKPWFLFERGENNVTVDVIEALKDGELIPLLSGNKNVDDKDEDITISTAGNYLWAAYPSNYTTFRVEQLGSSVMRNMSTVVTSLGTYVLLRDRVPLKNEIFTIELIINK